MKRIRLQFLYFCLVLSFFAYQSAAAVLAQAETPLFPDPPADDLFIVDLADLVTEQDEITINSRANALWQEEQIPIYVVTIPSLADQNAADYSIERYAAALFSIWGIGSAEKNLGMLLVVSRDDRWARIELGADWDRSADNDAQKIMDNDIIPQFKVENYSAGIVNGVEGLAALAVAEPAPTPRPSSAGSVPTREPITRTVSPSNSSGSSGFDCSSIFVWILMIPMVLFNLIRGALGGGDSSGGSSGYRRSGGGSSFRSRSSSGRSFSSSSRGGGFSRGGGASGRW
ncbi:MAG: TPM domain-containing protein [Anaerolineales bacterium]|nr:TPM domain-containing protein [Anaerolineales bacterium]